MRLGKITIWTLVLTCLISLPTSAESANENASASVDQKEVSLGETVHYTIELKQRQDGKVGIPQPPNFPEGLSVTGERTSSRLTIQNGKRSRRISKIYTLRAVEPGTHTIPPPLVRFGNQKIRLEEIEITVTGSRRQRSKGDSDSSQNRRVIEDGKIFVESSLESGDRFYVGQQVHLFYDLYVDKFRIHVRPSIVTEPTFRDFWLEDISADIQNRQRTVRVGGRVMDRRRLRHYILFPLESGEYRIEPLEIRLNRVGFMQRPSRSRLNSKPIKLEIEPLPPGGPADFESGNVGKWSFQVNVDVGQAKVGEPVEVEVVAKGTGNPHQLTLPEFPQLEGMDLLNEKTTIDKSFNGESLEGRRVKHLTLMPTESGRVEIPDLEFSYFDPASESYETDTSGDSSFFIRDGQLPAGYQKDQPPNRDGDSNAPQDSDETESIGELFDETTVERDTGLSRQIWAVGAGVPLLGLILLFLYPRMTRWIKAPIDRAKETYDRHRKLKQFAEWSKNPPEPKVLHKAVVSRLRETLGVSGGEITSDDIEQILEPQSVPAQLRKRIRNLLENLEGLRYNPDTRANEQQLGTLSEKVHQVLKELDETLQ